MTVSNVTNFMTTEQINRLTALANELRDNAGEIVVWTTKIADMDEIKVLFGLTSRLFDISRDIEEVVARALI